MIAQLEGQVTWVGGDSLILNVQGVGYLVSGTAAVLQEAAQKQTLSLWIETLVREEAISLYGFLERGEQELFRLLLGVQGVGARVALNLLSTFGGETLQNLLLCQDKKALVRAEGVGNKLAERVIIELKDKIGKLSSRGGKPGTTPSSLFSAKHPHFQMALEALASLGYRTSESLPALERALQKSSPEITLEDLVRQGLSCLSELQGKAS